MKLLIFNIKWLKTIKNMIKVYQVSRRYIMLFMHNNKYLPLTGLLRPILLQWTIHNTAWNFWNISEIFNEIFQGKKISRNFTSLIGTRYQRGYVWWTNVCALNVCWKHICLTEAAALSDFYLFLCTAYKFSYLLSYLLTICCSFISDKNNSRINYLPSLVHIRDTWRRSCSRNPVSS